MGANENIRRVYMFLEEGGDELVIEVADGKTVHRETFGDGVVLERGAKNEALRIRLRGLTEERWTNSTIAPAETCDGKPLVDGGDRIYLWRVSRYGMWTRMYVE